MVQSRQIGQDEEVQGQGRQGFMTKQLSKATERALRETIGSRGRWPWLSLAVAVVIGIQLGALPWRYRKELWQLQGAVVGAMIGFCVGRLSRPERDDKEQR